HGRTVDFRNTLVIMTSNLGTSGDAKEAIGFPSMAGQKDQSVRMRTAIEDALKQAFRPEFLNRVDEIIVFDPLTQEQIGEIVGLMTHEVEQRLAEHEIGLELTDAAKDWLAKEGFDPVYGARPLRRAIQKYVENELSKKVLAHEFKAGDKVAVDTDDNGLTFSTAFSRFSYDRVIRCSHGYWGRSPTSFAGTTGKFESSLWF
ncbi:MAG: AAA family ATPase, partial [Chloroflexi bacterium]|nr:AAA family ATPase [Chloroflexota bacterium]